MRYWMLLCALNGIVTAQLYMLMDLQLPQLLVQVRGMDPDILCTWDTTYG